MKRYRVKLLLNAVWSALDAERETAESENMSLENKAVQIQARQRIVETLENPAFKGKQLVKEVELQVQELIRLKRQHTSTANGSGTI